MDVKRSNAAATSGRAGRLPGALHMGRPSLLAACNRSRLAGIRHLIKLPTSKARRTSNMRTIYLNISSKETPDDA